MTLLEVVNGTGSIVVMISLGLGYRDEAGIFRKHFTCRKTRKGFYDTNMLPLRAIHQANSDITSAHFQHIDEHSAFFKHTLSPLAAIRNE